MALDLSALDADEPSTEAQPVRETAPRAPLSEFVEDEDQPRFEFDVDDPEFIEFVEDIRVRGILQPVVVVLLPNGKKKIRFGARRFRAAGVLGLPDIPYFVTEDVRQFDDYSQVAENEQRKGLQPLELAFFAKKRLDKGDKKKVVAKGIKVDPSVITHLMALIDLPAPLLELYHSRKCRSAQYLYELRKLHEKNPEVVERRCAQADEIDKPLIRAIAQEINPVAPGPADQPTVKDVLDTVRTGGGGGASGGGAGASTDHDANDGESGTSDPAILKHGTEGEDVKVQQLPSHNPAIEKGNEKTSDPDKIKKPLLLGSHKGRDVMIVLTKRPTSAGLITVRFEDGTGEEEVEIGQVTMTMLSDSQV
jgi:ParB family chromosome partitioning protein